MGDKKTKKFTMGGYIFSAEENGETCVYSVRFTETDPKVIVDEAVYQELQRSIWREEKQDMRSNRRCLPLDYEYPGGGSLYDFKPQTTFPTPENYVLQKEHREEIANTVRLLSDKDQQLIEAIYFQGMTEQKYADKISVPRQTIHSRKQSALQKMKKI